MNWLLERRIFSFIEIEFWSVPTFTTKFVFETEEDSVVV